MLFKTVFTKRPSAKAKPTIVGKSKGFPAFAVGTDITGYGVVQKVTYDPKEGILWYLVK